MADHPDWNVLMRTCPSRTSLAEIANKWTAMIVVVLGPGPMRFTAIRTAVEGVSGKVLSETLRRLERDGIVERRAYDRMPPHVEYELTPLGRTLREPLDSLRVWAETHIESVLDSRASYDAREPELRTTV